MTNLQIPDDLAQMIHHEAERRNLPVEGFLKAAVERERTLSDRKELEQELEWWLSTSSSVRAKYANRYVAIHLRNVVDHDLDSNRLYRRVRQTFGNTAVLIIPADGLRDIQIYSPRLVR